MTTRRYPQRPNSGPESARIADWSVFGRPIGQFGQSRKPRLTTVSRYLLTGSDELVSLVSKSAGERLPIRELISMEAHVITLTMTSGKLKRARIRPYMMTKLTKLTNRYLTYLLSMVCVWAVWKILIHLN